MLIIGSSEWVHVVCRTTHRKKIFLPKIFFYGDQDPVYRDDLPKWVVVSKLLLWVTSETTLLRYYLSATHHEVISLTTTAIRSKEERRAVSR